MSTKHPSSCTDKRFVRTRNDHTSGHRHLPHNPRLTDFGEVWQEWHHSTDSLKQKVRYVLRSRGMAGGQLAAPESAVEGVEEIVGGLVRSVYTRSNVSTHTPTDQAEVLRVQAGFELSYASRLAYLQRRQHQTDAELRGVLRGRIHRAGPRGRAEADLFRFLLVNRSARRLQGDLLGHVP